MEVIEADVRLVRIVDGLGTELFAVPPLGEVWGGATPDALMRWPYVFGCPPELFVGTIAH